MLELLRFFDGGEVTALLEDGEVGIGDAVGELLPLLHRRHIIRACDHQAASRDGRKTRGGIEDGVLALHEFCHRLLGA